MLANRLEQLESVEKADTPGVNTVVNGTQATLVIYAVVFAGIAGFALQQRDVE